MKQLKIQKKCVMSDQPHQTGSYIYSSLGFERLTKSVLSLLVYIYFKVFLCITRIVCFFSLVPVKVVQVQM